MPKTWFITGATRGIGRDIARGALANGDQVVATGRDIDRTRAAFDKSDSLLVTALYQPALIRTHVPIFGVRWT